MMIQTLSPASSLFPDFESMAIRHRLGRLEILDQSQLPQTEEWLEASEVSSMCDHIRELRVRGAPMISIAASFCLAKMASEGVGSSELKAASKQLLESRPTAVNLAWALARLQRFLEHPSSLVEEAMRIFDEDRKLCEQISKKGAKHLASHRRILTLCNTGSLATAGQGTALGIIKQLHAQNKKPYVFVCETRPLLQGARLTSWELKKEGIDFELLTDSMAGDLMQQGKVDAVLVGADRITSRGDTANKIGTYSLAVLAHFHGIPFFVAAPRSSVDLQMKSGEEILVEQRRASEVQGVDLPHYQLNWSASASQVYNPAFDVTPAELIEAWILDDGVYSYENLQQRSFQA